MKKPVLNVLMLLTALFAAFTLGFFLGKSRNSGDIQVSVSASTKAFPTTASTDSTVPAAATEPTVSFPIVLRQCDFIMARTSSKPILLSKFFG